MEFDNLKYSPGWFAKKFPGFYNEECYYILSDYFLNKTTERTGVKRTLDDLYQDDEEGVEETKDVLPTELDTIDQPLADLEGDLQGSDVQPDLLADEGGERTLEDGSDAQREQGDDEPTGCVGRDDDLEREGDVCEPSDTTTLPYGEPEILTEILHGEELPSSYGGSDQEQQRDADLLSDATGDAEL